MQVEMTSREIHARHTGTDGKSYVAEHRVWSTDEKDGGATFIAARQADANSANAKAARDAQPALAKVEQITEEQYRKERK